MKVLGGAAIESLLSVGECVDVVAEAMRSVARQAGVSTMTVSRVLSQPGSVAPETCGRILQPIGAQGYAPNDVAGSLRARRARGVVWCGVCRTSPTRFSATPCRASTTPCAPRIAFVGSTHDRDVRSAQRTDGWRMALRATGVDPAGLMFEADGTTVGGQQVLRRMAGEPVQHRAIDLGYEVLVRAST